MVGDEGPEEVHAGPDGFGVPFNPSDRTLSKLDARAAALIGKLEQKRADAIKGMFAAASASLARTVADEPLLMGAFDSVLKKLRALCGGLDEDES